MRTVNEYNVDLIFKTMFDLRQPHEISEKQRQMFIKNMRIAPEVLTTDYFAQAAARMGVDYKELFFMASSKLIIFAPIVLSDYYVGDGKIGFLDRCKDDVHKSVKQDLEESMEQGDFESVFWSIDKRGRHLAYFKLFHRIPDEKKFDIFFDNLDSPGREYFFERNEIDEILSYRHLSKRWNKGVQTLTRDYGESEYVVVYQPEFGKFRRSSHDFYWKLDKEDAVKESHKMKTNGRIKERLVHISKVLHYDNEDRSIQALPEHTKKIRHKISV